MPRKLRTYPAIQLKDGRVLWTREEEAESNGVCEKTVARDPDVAVTYVGNVAYCVKGAYSEAVAAKLRSRNAPPAPSRQGGIVMASPPDRADVMAAAVLVIVADALRSWWVNDAPINRAEVRRRVADRLRDDYAELEQQLVNDLAVYRTPE
jgi:hypothetical protein